MTMGRIYANGMPLPWAHTDPVFRGEAEAQAVEESTGPGSLARWWSGQPLQDPPFTPAEWQKWKPSNLTPEEWEAWRTKNLVTSAQEPDAFVSWAAAKVPAPEAPETRRVSMLLGNSFEWTNKPASEEARVVPCYSCGNLTNGARYCSMACFAVGRR